MDNKKPMWLFHCNDDPNEFVPNKGDLSFYATHPEPDGTTLSLIEYSFAYSAFWQAEATLIYTADEIGDFVRRERYLRTGNVPFG